MIEDPYLHDLRIVWAILGVLDALPLDELRRTNAAAFANLPFAPADMHARTLIAVAEDAEAIRILRDAQQRLRRLKAENDGRRTRRQSLNHPDPLDAPTGH